MTKKDISKKPARAKKIVRRDEQRDYDRIEAEIAAISDIVPSQENLWKDKEYEGYVPPRALCCMFEQEDAEKAVNESNLEFVEELFKSNRHSHFLCRCRKCGALVIQQYEELIWFDWDNADCFDRYLRLLFFQRSFLIGEGRIHYGTDIDEFTYSCAGSELVAHVCFRLHHLCCLCKDLLASRIGHYANAVAVYKNDITCVDRSTGTLNGKPCFAVACHAADIGADASRHYGKTYFPYLLNITAGTINYCRDNALIHGGQGDILAPESGVAGVMGIYYDNVSRHGFFYCHHNGGEISGNGLYCASDTGKTRIFAYWAKI